MIKVLSKSIAVDENTFQPLLILKIAIPMEAIHDERAYNGDDSLHTKIGKELVEAISNVQNNTTIPTINLPELKIKDDDDRPVSPLAHRRED